MYPINVWFTWDPDKSDGNLAARGFDFEFASRMFDGVTLERQDDRREYGELRVVAVGKVTDGLWQSNPARPRLALDAWTFDGCVA